MQKQEDSFYLSNCSLGERSTQLDVGNPFYISVILKHIELFLSQFVLQRLIYDDKIQRLVAINGIYHVRYSVRNSLDKLERTQQFTERTRPRVVVHNMEISLFCCSHLPPLQICSRLVPRVCRRSILEWTKQLLAYQQQPMTQ